MRIRNHVTILVLALGTLLFGFVSSSAQPTNGLLGYYPMTGNGNDESVNNWDLSAYSGASLTYDRWGYYDRSYAFSESGNGMWSNVGTAYSTSNVTLSAWIRIDGAGDNNPRIVAVGPQGTSYQHYNLCLNGTGSSRALVFNGIQSTTTYPTGGPWLHVAATYNGTQVMFYANGSLVSTANYSTPLGTFSSAILQVGYSDNGLDRFVGCIDEVRIYNRALSASEIYQCFSPTNGLLMFVRMNSTHDSTGHTLGFVSSNVTATTDRYGTANECYSFNGQTSQMNKTVGSGFSVDALTLSAWIAVTGTGDHNPRILSVGPTGSSYQRYAIALVGIYSPRAINFCANISDGNPAFSHNSTTRINTDESWHHIVVTYDRSNVKFYIDGALSDSIAETAALPGFSNTARMQVGYSDNGYDRFRGKIDDIRIYNRALTASEISDLSTPPVLTVRYNGNTITPPLNFGVVPVSSSAQKVIRFTNNGGRQLTISNQSIIGDYSMTSLPASIAINSYQDVTVTFTPATAGTQNGTLSFTHNAQNSPYSLALTGTGAQLTLTQPNGGEVYTVGVSNTITWNATGVSGTALIDLNTNYPSGSWTYLTRQGISFGSTSWTPTSDQVSSNARIRVRKEDNTYSDISDANFTIAQPPSLSVTRNGASITPPLDFESVHLSSESQIVVRLANTGGCTLTISNPSITGEYSMSTVPSSIEAEAYSDVTLTFTPTVTGTRTGTFSFTHNATNSPYSLSMTGTGVSYTNGNGVQATGSGGNQTPWTPTLPNDPGTSNQPPIDIVFPGTSGTTPSSIEVSYNETPPVPENPPFLQASSINRFWTLNQIGGSAFGADLTFRFVADVDPNNLRGGFITASRSTDGGVTWTVFANGLTATPNGDAFEVLVPNVSEFSDWALGSGSVLPVELSTFYAVGGDSRVTLSWRTETEVNNSYFKIYRSTIESEQGELLTCVNGHGNSAITNEYRFMDTHVINGITYYYRIADVSFDGIEHLNRFVVSATPQIHALGEIPIKYSLDQNRPNPFNPKTRISYGIHKEGHVRLSVFNLLGQEVTRLVDEYQTPNMYQVEFNGTNLNAGTYYYSLSTKRFSSVKKMVLLK